MFIYLDIRLIHLIFHLRLHKQQDVQKDPVKYKDAIKKLLGYMTMGIDMSPLFSEMIMVCIDVILAR